MKILTMSLSLSLLFWVFQQIQVQAHKIECLWIAQNLRHQQNVKKRVDHYFPSRLSFSNCSVVQILKNQDGSLSIIAILFILLAISLCWTTLATMLEHRSQILKREQMMSCISSLETDSQNYEKKMQKLNFEIIAVKVAEAAARSIPTQQVHLPALALAKKLLQHKQQLITFTFGSILKLPFKNCRGFPPWGLILHQNRNLILERDPLTETTRPKFEGKTFLWQKNFKAMVAVKKNSNKLQYFRTLYEGAMY